MLRKISIAIFSLFFSLSLTAQNESANNHYLQWGKIHIPITESINGLNGSVDLKLSEMLTSADEPIFIIKNGEDGELKSFNLVVSKRKMNAAPNIIAIDNYDKKDAVKLHGKAFLKENLKEGEFIYLKNLMGKDGMEFSLNLRIKYENAPHNLGFEIPDIPKGEVFGFQIVDFGDEIIQVKLDSLDVKNERIFNMYKKLKNYKIVHIPNFKTTRRYITTKDKIVFENEMQLNCIENEDIKNLDIGKLSEFSSYDRSNIILKWGEMTSSNSIHSTADIRSDIIVESETGEIFSFKSYDQYDLEDAMESRFMLSQGFQTFEIVRFKIVILASESLPISFVSDDIKNPKIISELEKIKSETTILFTDILIKNKEEDVIIFPPSFLFVLK